jgi:NAD(P)-dependent dehydrogenase (short-subunit alcohol dehydrogenase family)
MKLEPGRVAVVTGSAGGIGLAMADVAAAAGLHVLLADVDGDRLASAREQVAAHGTSVETITCDVGRYEEIERLAEAAYGLGDVQLVCSNAGIQRGGAVWELEPSTWRQVLDVNLMASVHICGVFLPRLIESGRPGHVVITGSMASVTARAGNGPYSVAKHGLLALAETTQHDLDAAGHPIGVTLLMPGLVATPLVKEYGKAPSAISAARAAEVAFEAIAADRLFAFTHPDSVAGVRERFAAITEQRTPEVPGM